MVRRRSVKRIDAACGRVLVCVHQMSRPDLAATLAQARAELCRGKREIQNPRRENKILREAAEPMAHHAAACDRFAVIHAHRA